MATITHFIAGKPNQLPQHDPLWIKEIFRQLSPWNVKQIEVDGFIYNKGGDRNE